MADFVISSLRGGMNNSDPAISLEADQAVLMENVEIHRSLLGERRRGTDAIDLPASISGKDRVSFLHRNVPGTDDTAAELFVFGFAAASSQLAKKTTSWSDITISDTVNISGFAPYQWSAVSLHGKTFFAFDSDVDRLHVLDAGGTTMRRTGVATPSAPTLADDGGSGTFSGVRYYRVRMTTQSGGVTLRRSEPSASATITPNGNDTGITVTKPTTVEDSTHWEIEASLDNVNFYVIDTLAVGTTTKTDTTDFGRGYAVDYELSEDIGDYSNIWSARYLVADEDRLVFGGSWETSSQASTVGWTPVGNADGSGNDERYELDTDPTAPLDGLEGGSITGLTAAVSGEIWAFKFKSIFKLVRSGLRSRAYDTVCMTKDRGALHGSAVAGVDQAGRPCVYFLDPAVGPCRAGVGGIQQCGADIRTTWELVNLDATKVVCSGLYYPATRQVIWNIAVSGSNVPSRSIVLQTNETRNTEDTGVRRGWVQWTGTRSAGLAMCLYSTNIDDNAARNRVLVPFIGTEGSGLVHRCDTGTDDNGTAYAATIRTKPYTLKSLLYKFGVKSAGLLAKAVTGAKVTVKLLRDFGLETAKTITGVTFDASGSETDVIKVLDDFSGSELRVAQFEFVDTSPAGTRFELNQFVLIETVEQRN